MPDGTAQPGMARSSIANLHDLFEHELKDIYDAESKLVDALKKQAAETTDPTVRAGFQAHQKETERQKERLERVFDIWGKEPDRGEGCDGIDGLLEEHKSFKDHSPRPEILDIFNLSAAQKVERYEITAYTSLVQIADWLGLDDAAELLNQNLQEEERMLEKLVDLGDDTARLDQTPSHVKRTSGASR
jgi:ferritin-like metal-binding protein YciE